MYTIKNYLLLLLIFSASCAKEIYTNEDATNSKREAQKVGVTVMLRDINHPETDMSGFEITTSQCGEDMKAATSADGLADLMLVKGDAVLRIRKEGYVTATAVITTNATEKERNNTAVVIPVFADTQTSGAIYGNVLVRMSPSVEEPLANALVSIEVDINELMRLAFPGMSGNIDKYRPGILAYSADANLMQPVRTSVSGAFQLTIPVTATDLTYTVRVHETPLAQNSFCSAEQIVMTNGQRHQEVIIQLTPYEK